MKKLSELTVEDRCAIRAVADERPIGAAARAHLFEAGMVQRDPADLARDRLTERGLRAYDYIMSSGDGPEALKAMFRF